MNEQPENGDVEIRESLSPAQEATLVEACTSGDSSAWYRLVDTYGPRVYGAIRYFLRAFRESMTEEDSRNIYQELFLDLCSNNFRKLKSFHGGGKLTTWLFTVARRQCLDYVRASSRIKRYRPKAAGPEVLDLGRPLTEQEDHVAATENKEAVHAALERLDPKNRMLIILFYYEGLSYEEIAKVVDVSEHSLSHLMKRARDEITKILEE